MKIMLFIIIFFSSINLFTEEIDFPYYANNAIIPQKGQIKYSLFNQAEYGINENISLRLHPITLFLSPTIAIKYNFFDNKKLMISSVHSLSYPSFMLNLIKNKGAGGFISPEYDIPHAFSMSNGIISSYKIRNQHLMTASLDFEFGINNSELHPGTSIDIPIILPRTMVYYKNIGFNFVCSVEGNLISNIDYLLKNQMYLFPFSDDEYDYEYQETSNSFFNETSIKAFWRFNNSFKMGIGGMLCYGTYPYGRQWHLIPNIDFVKVIN